MNSSKIKFIEQKEICWQKPETDADKTKARQIKVNQNPNKSKRQYSSTTHIGSQSRAGSHYLETNKHYR